MILDLYLAMATATLTVCISTAEIGHFLRKRFNPAGVLNCVFCTSIWVAAVLTSFTGFDSFWLRVPAIVAVSNVAILLIHLGMSIVGDEND